MAVAELRESWREVKYSVDLAGLQRDGELIYLLLSRFLGEMPLHASRTLVMGDQGHQNDVHLEVIEVTPYTAVIQLTPESSASYTQGFAMQIRAYHDACIADIVRCDHLHQLLPKYPYPNDRMLQPDEKAQLHRFVREWLAHCDKFGRSPMNWEWPWKE